MPAALSNAGMPRLTRPEIRVLMLPYRLHIFLIILEKLGDLWHYGALQNILVHHLHQPRKAAHRGEADVRHGIRAGLRQSRGNLLEHFRARALDTKPPQGFHRADTQAVARPLRGDPQPR
eukprot:scaffold442_cov268-Pinguiococcus_pyrenoidosus.AAC.57